MHVALGVPHLFVPSKNRRSLNDPDRIALQKQKNRRASVPSRWLEDGGEGPPEAQELGVRDAKNLGPVGGRRGRARDPDVSGPSADLARELT
eukprot:7947682-Pyramimonas_sp.AAC.1